MSSIAHVGLDVHLESITVAVLPEGVAECTEVCAIPNQQAKVEQYFRRLSKRYELRCCYEAGGCGYVLYRWLQKLGITCTVIAPSLVPKRSGNRIKTDRRDAKHLAEQHRAGQLVAVHVPTEEQEEARALVRCREMLVKEVKQSKHYVLKFLNQRGLEYREGKNWTQKHWRYLRSLQLPGEAGLVLREMLALLEYKLGRLEEMDRHVAGLAQSERYREAVGKLCCLRGVGELTAITLLVETVDFQRFGTAHQLMAYYGLVPSEHSSGGKQRQGGITKTGNAHCRRVLVEAAWHYQHAPGCGVGLAKRQQGQPPEAVAHAWKAQHRLHKKFWKIASRRKEHNTAAVATARELVGFIWGILTGRWGRGVQVSA